MATVLLSNQLLFDGIDADLLLVAAQALEAHDAVFLGKQGVILADAHVEAGMDVGAALTHQDVASQNELTIGALRAQTLAFAVAAVAGGAHTFFMSEQLNVYFKHY